MNGEAVTKKTVSCKIKESFDLWDIWRIQNDVDKRFMFCQKKFSGVIEKKLDHDFISNTLQESVKNADILASLSSDHSPALLALK